MHPSEFPLKPWKKSGLREFIRKFMRREKEKVFKGIWYFDVPKTLPCIVIRIHPRLNMVWFSHISKTGEIRRPAGDKHLSYRA